MSTTTRTTVTSTEQVNESMYIAMQIVSIVTVVTIALLALRAIMMIAGVSSTTLLPSMVYSTSNILLVPFTSIFGTLPIGTTGLEGAVLIAMAIYLTIGLGIRAILGDQSFTVQIDPKTRLQNAD